MAALRSIEAADGQYFNPDILAIPLTVNRVVFHPLRVHLESEVLFILDKITEKAASFLDWVDDFNEVRIEHDIAISKLRQEMARNAIGSSNQLIYESYLR